MDTFNGLDRSETDNRSMIVSHTVIDNNVSPDVCINKRKRHTFTREQLDLLETTFSTNEKPSNEVLDDLANRFGLTSYQIKVWFISRMAKLKKLGNFDEFLQEIYMTESLQHGIEYWQDDSNRVYSQEDSNSAYSQQGGYTNLSHHEEYNYQQSVSPEEFFRQLSPRYMEYIGRIVDEYYVNGTFIV